LYQSGVAGAGYAGPDRWLNGRALFQALEAGDLITLGGKGAFEFGHFAQQLDH